jgi:TrmH family RNA methyltransferase
VALETANGVRYSVSRITSRQHPVVRRLRRLAQRREKGVVVIDGPHLLADALAARVQVELVLSDGRHRALAERAGSAGAIVHEGSAAVLEAASPVTSPTGIVAVARWEPQDLADVLAAEAPIVGLVGVQDPGNVGSVIRSADALGAGGVVLLDQSADPGSWKCLRGAMGSTFRIPIARGRSADLLEHANARQRPVVAAVAAGGTPLESMVLEDSVVILVGNEGAGLSEELSSRATETVTITMRAGMDSLNVSVTAALVLWEAHRQRHAARRSRSAAQAGPAR